MKRKLTRLLLVASMVVIIIVGVVKTKDVDAASSSLHSPSPLSEGGWTLIQSSSDEFDSNMLDESKWTNGIWYSESGDLAFKDQNAYVDNGKLILRARYENYNGKSYTAGAVESKFEVPGESYVEVYAKVLDSRANVLSAIWLQSSPLSWNYNPNPEIDIIETFNYHQMTSTMHRWLTPTGIHFKEAENWYETGIADISKDYHKYGLLRTGGGCKFYFDDKLVWQCYLPYDSFGYMSRHMVLSLEGHNGRPVATALPAKFEIDYVRTYMKEDFSNPLPAGTYCIINGKADLPLAVPAYSYNDNSQLRLGNQFADSFSKWILEPQYDGTYVIVNYATGKAVDVEADGYLCWDGTKINQYPKAYTLNQKWYILPAGNNGNYKIVSAASGKALVVKDAKTSPGSLIVQWPYGDGPDTNDEWWFSVY